MDKVKLLPSPIERLAEHLSARWTIPTSREAVAHWIDYSLNRCGLVVVEEQSLARPTLVTDELVERVARAIFEKQYPTGTTWDDWDAYVENNLDHGFDGRDPSREIARAALAASDRDILVEEVRVLTDEVSDLRGYIALLGGE